MNEEIQKYFSILIDSLYARIQGNEEEEDLLLGYLDKIWDNLTSEQIEIISKIIKQFKNDWNPEKLQTHTHRKSSTRTLWTSKKSESWW